MLNSFLQEQNDSVILITIVQKKNFSAWLESQKADIKKWISANNFTAEDGQCCILPNHDGAVSKVLFAVNNKDAIRMAVALPAKLGKGCYQFDLSQTGFDEKNDLPLFILYWGLGLYQFSRYRAMPPITAQLVLPKNVDLQYWQDLMASTALIKDLINTPADDLTPQDLAQAVCDAVKPFSAKSKVIAGEALLKNNYPAVYTVGRGSHYSPHVVDVQWGDPKHPKITLIGKGICFDSGGLDIKNSTGMLLMKKDMAGAAHALGLARLIMAQQLPVCLRLIIPAAENAVSGNSYHPGDVIKTRAGFNVEITNTDAEGRLVLCDALAAAVEDNPDCIIDFSTLTGAARVALGPKIPAFFCNDNQFADNLLKSAEKMADPFWRLPLHQRYREYLKSNVADFTNASKAPFAGAITAALFLQSFVPDQIPWAHFDMSAWNLLPVPGEIEEAEVFAIRAVFAYLRETF